MPYDDNKTIEKMFRKILDQADLTIARMSEWIFEIKESRREFTAIRLHSECLSRKALPFKY